MTVVASQGSLVTTQRSTLFPNIRRGITLYNGHAETYAELYRLQPNLRLVIRFLGRNIGDLGINAYRRVDDTTRVPLDPGHDLAVFLKNPVPASTVPVSQYAWIRSIVEDLALYDALYMLKLRNEASGRLNALRVPPPMMAPIGESFFWPDAFRLTGNRGFTDYDPAAVINVHGHNPDDPKIGLSPVEALRQILAEEWASGEYREQFWRNAGRISGVISRPPQNESGKWSELARDRFLEEWRANWTGSGTTPGGTPILEDGMTFIPSGFSAQESEYLGGRRLTREETAAAYFIPPVFVGILEFANFSNITEQHKSLYSDTLGPWLDDLTEALELQLVPEFDDVEDVYLEFNIEAKLAGRFEEQATALQAAVGAPWMLRSEARAKMNLPPVEGLDQPVTPLNVLIGGQASPQDSAPPATTGTASRKALERGTKDGLPRYLHGWEAKHVEVLTGFFERQKSSVIAKLGAGQDLADAFEADRWNAELKTDLFALSLAMTEDVGGQVAAHLGGEFDLARTEAWLGSNAEIAAGNINQTTYDSLSEAWSGVAVRGAASRAGLKDDVAAALAEIDGLDLTDDDLADPLGGESFLDPARSVFDLAISARVGTLATGRATSIGQWSRREAAGQSGAQTKTWVSSGLANSRHDALDGETVGLGEAFSNGLQYPGDPEGGVDETAGCQCSLDFGT